MNAYDQSEWSRTISTLYSLPHPKRAENNLELNELTFTRFSSIVPVFSVSSFLNISVTRERRQTRMNIGTNWKACPILVLQGQKAI